MEYNKYEYTDKDDQDSPLPNIIAQVDAYLKIPAQFTYFSDKDILKAIYSGSRECQLRNPVSTFSGLSECNMSGANDRNQPGASEFFTQVPSKGILTILALRVHLVIIKDDNYDTI